MNRSALQGQLQGQLSSPRLKTGQVTLVQPLNTTRIHVSILLAHCICLFIVYSCPVRAVLVGALLAHIDAMPTQPSKKRKHESYSNSEKAWLLEIYDENSRLSTQELGERLAEHVNSKRSADLVPKLPPGKQTVFGA
jgi:hypothetical protein